MWRTHILRIPGLDAGGGGGTTIAPSSSSSATSGPAISGGAGPVTFGAVNAGGSSSTWLWIVGAVLLVLFWKPIKKRLHL